MRTIARALGGLVVAAVAFSAVLGVVSELHRVPDQP
jgi:hypothetical protein